MSSNNNSSEGMVFALFGAGILIMAFMLFALAAFAAFILTILALLAWNEPFSIGKMTMTPQEARIFVKGGLVGALGLPSFLMFVSLLFSVEVAWDQYAHYILIAGYVLGSFGFAAALIEPERPQTAPERYYNPTARLPAPSPQALGPLPESQPFKFASWNDEEDVQSSDRPSKRRSGRALNDVPRLPR